MGSLAWLTCGVCLVASPDTPFASFQAGVVIRDDELCHTGDPGSLDSQPRLEEGRRASEPPIGTLLNMVL